MQDKKEIEHKAQENLRQWYEFLDKINNACEQSDISLEQGLSFLDNLYKNDHN